MRRFLPFILLLASCGEPATLGNAASNVQTPAEAAPVTEARPVRVGELGPNFRACSAAGTTRNLRAGENLPVRVAPSDNAADSGSVPVGARFFVCAGSHDQKWLGIVFDPSGTLAESCGVAAPVTPRRDYAGPCKSGWVQSAFVKLISGIDPPLPSKSAEGAG